MHKMVVAFQCTYELSPKKMVLVQVEGPAHQIEGNEQDSDGLANLPISAHITQRQTSNSKLFQPTITCYKRLLCTNHPKIKEN